MKILLTTAELGYRGTPRTLANYARILSAKHDVLIWGWREGGPIADELIACGYKVLIGPGALEIALHYRPDIVNIHRPGLPQKDESYILRRMKAAHARIVETNVFGRVDPSCKDIIDISINISLWDLAQWRSWAGFKYPVRSVYCPNIVDCDAFRRLEPSEILSARKSLGIAGNAFVIGRIGNTDWSIFEAAICDVLNKWTDVFLVHVADHNDEIPNEIRRHPRVRCLSRLNDSAELSRFYSLCDCCVSMSKIGESFGLVNAESMSCRTPVIALSTPFHCNAQTEVVEHNKNGVVIKHASDLIVAVDELKSQRDRLDKFSASSRESIEFRYSVNVVSPFLLELFESLNGGRLLPLKDGILGYNELYDCDIGRQYLLSRLGLGYGRWSLADRLMLRLLYTRAVNRFITKMKTGMMRKCFIRMKHFLGR